MPHELSYDSETNCATLRFQGEVTMALIREVAPQVASLCKEKGCRHLLNDMSAATINLSVFELFDSPKTMDESGVSRTIKRALVVPSDFDESQFLEDVSRNRGHNLMVFKDMAKAKDWLLAE